LIRLAENDPRVLLLTGDHGYSLFDNFRKKHPRQYINAGIAEQNMVGVAAGLARTGFKPFVYGLSSFIPIRVIEQIKIDVAYDNLPVVFIGDGAGFVYSHLGASHQSTEDISCIRSIPEISIYSPSDRFEVISCMRRAYEIKSPVYLRIGKSDRGDVHKDVPELDCGLINVMHGKSNDYALIATGSMVRTAIDIASNDYPINMSVWSAPIIKPISYKHVISICNKSKAIIVLEEHSKYGGLGSVIAEIASQYSPIRILRVAVDDKFSNKCGTYDYLLKEHLLDYQSVRNSIQKFISRI